MRIRHSGWNYPISESITDTEINICHWIFTQTECSTDIQHKMILYLKQQAQIQGRSDAIGEPSFIIIIVIIALGYAQSKM